MLRTSQVKRFYLKVLDTSPNLDCVEEETGLFSENRETAGRWVSLLSSKLLLSQSSPRQQGSLRAPSRFPSPV